MIFHYEGKFNGEESTLPKREHPKNSVVFKEPSMKQFTWIANIGCLILIAALLALLYVRTRDFIIDYIIEYTVLFMLSVILPNLTLFPHELLHALCFKKDVYAFTYFSKGVMFVVGCEDMSKARFIFMSLLPNLVFGFIPYLVFLFFPNLIVLGTFGAFCIGMGFGDYINVFNAATQVPKDAQIYMSGFHTYWYEI